MGHHHLGELPRTRKWQEVVSLIEGGADAAQVASATMTAAQRGLSSASADKGLVNVILLLMRLPLAARAPNFVEALQDTGLDVTGAPTLMQVAGAFSDVIDRGMAATGARTDLAEMAQMAAVETLSAVVGKRTSSIFGSTADDVRRELANLATAHQFGAFMRQFFARVTERYLTYFLSRQLPHHLGEGNRFATTAQQAAFTKGLEVHCYEASRIAEAFSGQWLSKTNWETGGVTRQQVKKFTHVAMEKLADEMAHRAR
jgi:hypothetical protein